MTKHLFRQRQARGHEKGRPIDGMKPDDVLADDVHVGRPILLERFTVLIGKPDAGDVVRQRVDPDIHDVLGIAGYRHAPIERCARHGKILEPAAHEALHLVRPRLGSDELRVRFVMGKQPVLKRREPEEIAFFLDPLDGRALRRQFPAVRTFLQLAFVVEGLVAYRIPAGIFVEIDVARRLHAPPQLLRRALMTLFARRDEIVVGAIEHAHHLAEFRRVAVSELGRRDALGPRRLEHLDAVLVGAGEEEHVPALQAPEARKRVRRHGLIGMADVRRIVRIGDRRGDVIGPRGSHGGDIALRPAPGKHARPRT